ncbi:hypothetical protein NKG05_26455 [Oerskovia sp. M15]
MLLDGAREAIAAGLGARTEEIHLSSSHTASLHAAVGAVALGRRRVGPGSSSRPSSARPSCTRRSSPRPRRSRSGWTVRRPITPALSSPSPSTGWAGSTRPR